MSQIHTSLRVMLETSAQRYAERTALTMIDGGALTYSALWQKVQDLSTFLREQGVNKNDRLVILGENSPNWGIAYFAVTTIGSVAVPVLPDFHPSDIARIIRHAEARGIFISRRLFGKLCELRPEELGMVVLLDDLTVVPAGSAEADLGAERSNRANAGASGLPLPPVAAISGDDVAAIVYTSGTTGHSKGVMLTHGNLISDVVGTTKIVDIDHEDRFLSILPLPHTYECTLGLIAPLMLGASVYYMEKPPTAPVLLPALQKVRPTVMLSVPLIIEKIYKAKILPELTKKPLLRRLHRMPPSRKLLHRIAGRKLLKIFGGRLRIFTIGGAPLAPDVELFLREGKFPYAIGYGLTETSPLIAGTGPSRTRFRSTGPALPGTQIRIANRNPETGEGEIQVKGPTVMKGYYKDPERTREVFTEDGWLKTGDLGMVEPDDYVFIKGRLKNMILGPSGKNIYPEEIEAVINEFETVRESVVYEHGNRIVALVHLDYEKLQKALQTLSETDIKGRVNAMLADLHKEINARVPLYARIHKIIEQAEPFEKTPTQKIKRHLYIP
jgi:long-chain acyl-CoA synthetase